MPFSIVGIGASAGGLSAISELLSKLPDSHQIAMVVLQHLAPDHESILPAILRRSTFLTVIEATHGMKIEAGKVYVLPPGRELKIKNDELQLQLRTKGEPHPVIDLFFRSIAEEYKERAIGVVLSGSGSDGALGLCAIKSAGGFTFAQEPQSAQFDAMPLAAIGSGCVDRIATPAAIADQIVAVAENLPQLESRIDGLLHAESSELESQLKKIFHLLKKLTGNDFSHYKRSTIVRRLQRRMMLNRIDTFQAYVEFLENSQGELGELFRDLLINVTSFFRDKEAFDALKTAVFKPLIESVDGNYTIRVWIPACSTGEEVYSVAIALIESLEEAKSSASIQVFGTDVDVEAIERARKGTYSEALLNNISSERIQRFFTKTGEHYTVRKSLRELCVFAPQNVLADPPFSHIDVLCCRNLLIYLNRNLQERLLQIFHYALKADGVLFLGSSETTGPASDLFALLDKKNKIYRRKQIAKRQQYDFSAMSSKLPGSGELPISQPSIPANLPRKPYFDLEQLILNQFAPPGVVINEQLDIVYFLGHAGLYLDPLAGSASLNLFKLARREIVGDLRIVVDAAMRNQEAIQRTHVQYDGNNKNAFCTIEVRPLLDNLQSRFYTVIFLEQKQEPVKAKKSRTKGQVENPDLARIRALEQELSETKLYLQAVSEDHEATTEELQAASEEIQSTNEELQSTNEELETAREELQSTNEELATVNEELETRNTELMQTITDLNNLLNSVNIPIIMLDENLSIRKFTPSAGTLFNLINSDVGRPLIVIKPNIDLPELAPLVAEVLDTLTPKVMEACDRNGHWYELRLVPYRTEDRKITGCVLILVDITERKKNSERSQRMATVVSDSRYAIIVQDLEGKIQTWNPQATQLYGYAEEEMLGNTIESLIPNKLRKEMSELKQNLLKGKNVEAFHTRRITKSGKEIDMLISPSLLRIDGGEPYAIVTTERQANSEQS